MHRNQRNGGRDGNDTSDSNDRRRGKGRRTDIPGNVTIKHSDRHKENMAKKNVGGETDTTATEAGNGGKRARGRPRKYDEPNMLPADEERASLIVKKATWAKFKALTYWERRKQKNLLDEILTDYLKRWEKQHGAIKPIPENADI